MVSAKKCYTPVKLETISRLKNKKNNYPFISQCCFTSETQILNASLQLLDFFPGIISLKRDSFLNGWGRSHFSVGEGFIFRQRALFLPALMGGGSSKKIYLVGGMLPTRGNPAVGK